MAKTPEDFKIIQGIDSSLLEKSFIYGNGQSRRTVSKKREVADYPRQEEAKIPVAIRSLPRLKRRMGRYKQQPLPLYNHIRYYYPNPWVSGVQVIELQYDEGNRRLPNQEVTLDTVKNPFYQGDRKLLLDDGGPLQKWKIFWREHAVPVSFVRADGRNRYAYELFATCAGLHNGYRPDEMTAPLPEDLTAIAYHAKAWNIMKPAQLRGPNLGQLVAEIREIPNLIKQLKDMPNALRQLDQVGSAYLAGQFGVKPVVQDLVKVIYDIQKLERTVKFLLNNIGKPLHRRVELLTNEVKHEVLYAKSGYPYSGISLSYDILAGKTRNTALWSRDLKLRTETDIWARGQFVFHYQGRIPSIKELTSRTIGGEITPEVLWNLAPWTWAVDWLANLGDVISNISATVADQQFSTYAYIMKHTKRIYTWRGTDGYWQPTVDRVFDVKIREPIHPFGLAVDPGSLTPYQAGIIAALTEQRYNVKTRVIKAT